MNVVQFFDLSIFSIFLLATLLIVVYTKHELYSIKSRLFRTLIISTIVMLILEILSWVFDGEPGELNRILNYFFNSLFGALGVGVACVWAIYIHFIIFEDKKLMKKTMHLFLAPLYLMIIITTINIFVPVTFEIDANNIYARLPGVWTGIILTYFLYIVVLTMTLRFRQKIKSTVLVGVVIFLVSPIIAGMLQLVYLGLLLIWPSVSIAIIFTYLLFETTASGKDALTGAYTRQRAEEYILTLLKRRRSFSVIMIDMDNFKMLNDTFGHHIGDKVLIEMVNVLNIVFDKKDIVSRFGGDEFIIVTENTNKGDFVFKRNEVHRILEKTNDEYLQTMRFSMGISYCDGITKCTLENMIVTADNNMYLDKAKNKNYKRRRSDR